MFRIASLTTAFVAFALLGPLAGQTSAFDLVIRGGRVIDPETKTDRVANIGIRAGTIATISDAPLAGTRVIEARGRIVAAVSSIS